MSNVAIDGNVNDVLLKTRAFRVQLIGWARVKESGEPADHIVVFADDQFLYSGALNLDRPELARHYTVPGGKESGFVFFLPREQFVGNIRVFALTERGTAGELSYQKRLVPRDHHAF